MKKRLQTEIVTIPNGTAANGLIQKPITLDKNYKRCTGYAVYERSNANSHKYEIALSNNDGSIQDKVIADHLLTGRDIKPNERFFDNEFPANGEQININMYPLVNTTAAIEIYVVFRLEK